MSPRPWFVRSVLVVALASPLYAGCDKVNDENLDKWTHTANGPDKLKRALADESIDADLSAHAGANMVKKGMEGDLRATLEAMSPPRRKQVIGKLAPRLWELTRIEGEDNLPSAGQIAAKDVLFDLRKNADDADRVKIDGYLSDWYGVRSYEARAQSGAHLGVTVMRTIGPDAGKKLVDVINSLIAAPGQEKTKNKIGSELMNGVAASGATEGIKTLIDLAKNDRGDPTLPSRAINALYLTYVNPNGLFDIREPTPLVPHLNELANLAESDNAPGGVIDDSLALIAAAGAPACIAPLTSLIGYPHASPKFKFATANYAIKCGGMASVRDVVHQLPDVPYDLGSFQGSISTAIAKLSPKPQVLAAARDWLTDKSRIVRWAGLETMLAMKDKDDVPAIRKLQGDHAPLTGYWGDGSEGKPDPTVGDRAKEVADELTSGQPAESHTK